MNPKRRTTGEGEGKWALFGGAVGFVGGLILSYYLFPKNLLFIVPTTLITAAADAIAAAVVFRSSAHYGQDSRVAQALASTVMGGAVALLSGGVIGGGVGFILALTVCPGDGQAIFFVPILALLGGIIGGLLGLPVGAVVGLAQKD